MRNVLVLVRGAEGRQFWKVRQRMPAHLTHVRRLSEDGMYRLVRGIHQLRFYAALDLRGSRMICDTIKAFILVCGVIPLCLAVWTQINWWLYGLWINQLER